MKVSHLVNDFRLIAGRGDLARYGIPINTLSTPFCHHVTLNANGILIVINLALLSLAIMGYAIVVGHICVGMNLVKV